MRPLRRIFLWFALAAVASLLACSSAPDDALVGARQLATNGDGTCALLENGELRCWGRWRRPISADGEISTHAARSTLSHVAKLVDSEIDPDLACVAYEPGAPGPELACWGHWGSLDLREAEAAPRLAEMTEVRDVAVGMAGICVIATRRGDLDEKVWCLRGERLSVKLPELPAWRALAFDHAQAIGVGSTDICAIDARGEVLCASGSTGSIVRIDGIHEATQVGLGFAFGCARVKRGEVYCWGDDTRWVFQSDVPPWWRRHEARLVLRGASEMNVSQQGACALVAGEAWCWGFLRRIFWGSHAEEDYAPRPARADLPLGLVKVSLGRGSVCGIGSDGHIWCSGYDAPGWLGDGSYVEPRGTCGGGEEMSHIVGPRMVRTGADGESPGFRRALLRTFIVLFAFPLSMAVTLYRLRRREAPASIGRRWVDRAGTLGSYLLVATAVPVFAAAMLCALPAMVGNGRHFHVYIDRESLLGTVGRLVIEPCRAFGNDALLLGLPIALAAVLYGALAPMWKEPWRSPAEIRRGGRLLFWVVLPAMVWLVRVAVAERFTMEDGLGLWMRNDRFPWRPVYWSVIAALVVWCVGLVAQSVLMLAESSAGSAGDAGGGGGNS